MARVHTLDLDSTRQPRRPIRAIAAAGSVLIALALTGCDSGTQEPDAQEAEGVEYSAPVPAAETPSTATDSTDTASSAGSAAADRYPELPDGAARAIPDNFPSDMPVYPGAEAAIGMGGSIANSNRSGVQLLSQDSPEKVRDYYTAELEAKGWEITDTGDNGGTGYTISATQGDSQTMFFITPKAGGGSDVYQVVEQN